MASKLLISPVSNTTRSPIYIRRLHKSYKTYKAKEKRCNNNDTGSTMIYGTKC